LLHTEKRIILYCTCFSEFYAIGCVLPLRKTIRVIRVVTCTISKIILFEVLIAIIIIIIIITYSPSYFLVPHFSSYYVRGYVII